MMELRSCGNMGSWATKDDGVRTWDSKKLQHEGEGTQKARRNTRDWQKSYKRQGCVPITEKVVPAKSSISKVKKINLEKDKKLSGEVQNFTKEKIHLTNPEKEKPGGYFLTDRPFKAKQAEFSSENFFFEEFSVSHTWSQPASSKNWNLVSLKYSFSFRKNHTKSKPVQ